MMPFLLLLFIVPCTLHSYRPITYRSQGTNSARELIGITSFINQPRNDFYNIWNITGEYNQSLEPNRIADKLFGTDLSTPTLSALNITGSGVAQRNSTKDWLADYFGLPRDFSSTIRFNPVISNFLLDAYCYLGCNHIAQGLYITIHAPFVRTKWDLNYFESITHEGVADQPPGYFNQIATGNDVGVSRTNLLADFTDFVFHEQSPNLGNLVTFSPLAVAKMIPFDDRNHRTKIGFADVQITAGWNFLLDRWYHLGMGPRLVIPTGNKLSPTYIFAPVIGNGHHWELGAQIWGHYAWPLSENEQRICMFYAVANITHLFGSKECRVFDLLCKQNSLWMLAERMTSPVVNLQAAILPDNIDPSNLSTPSAQFANMFSPLANLTTREVTVRTAMQLDTTLMFSYIHRHFSVDAGYNLWYISPEKITKRYNANTPLTTQSWALKGDSYVYGFTSDVNPMIASDMPIALSATQSKATIHAGTNNFINVDGDMGGINGIRPTRNPGVDNPAYAAATFGSQTTTVNDRTIAFSGEQTLTSNNPILLTEDQLDLCAQRSHGLSNKFFVHFNHLWTDAPCNEPIGFLGSGLDIELSSKTSTVSQWAIWIKGGLYFH